MQQINNLAAKIDKFKSQINASVQRVVDSGWVVLGPEVKRFETAFAEYLQAGHCVSVANGTDAIELALKALGVADGDQVATVANAGMYTTTSVLAIGATPLFMDVDLDTHVVTLASVKQAIEAGAKAVVVTHLYGLAVPDIKAIAAYCAAHKVALLEDCAQAHGAERDGQRVGTFGDASSFSFYPTKNLGALGDGGAVVTNSAAIAQRVAQLRQYGWSSKYCVELAAPAIAAWMKCRQPSCPSSCRTSMRAMPAVAKLPSATAPRSITQRSAMRRMQAWPRWPICM